LSESLAALQRSTGQVVSDAASNRALVQQLQGANTVLAQENYKLKTSLSRPNNATTPTSPAFVSPSAVRVHVVASGDSLSKLSQRYYGTAGRWQEIYNANQSILGPNGVLRVGTSLRIP
jgi:nucleoid-associated protein YgaU